MHPSSRKHTFRFFFDRVNEVCSGKSLTERDILDVMQFKMGGAFLTEIKDLRGKGWDRAGVEEFFLKKDAAYENEKLKKEKILEECKKVLL